MCLQYRRTLICMIAAMCCLCAMALTPDEDLETTIENLHMQLTATQKNIDQELEHMQKTRVEYWKHTSQLQKEIDKVVLVLYSQDGGSLFSVGLASESLHNVCEAFRNEQVPFEKWLESMVVTSNQYKHTRTALEKIHQENLSPEHRSYVQQSIAICDSLDSRFAAMRDSIALDKEHYREMSKEIDEIEHINQDVVNRLREAIFNDNDEDVLTFWKTLDYQIQDVNHDSNDMVIEIGSKDPSDSVQQIKDWNKWSNLIGMLVFLLGPIAARFIFKKKSPYRVKRRYYSFLAAVGIIIVSGWLMPLFVDYNYYQARLEDVYTEFYWFLFLIILSATLRLPKPGIGWSMACYTPLIICAWAVIGFAVMLMRTSLLKALMPLLFMLMSIVIIVILLFGAKKIKKEDYATSFSCIGVVLLSTVLSLMGYYYISIIIVLYSMSVITFLSGLVCVKILFKRRLEDAGEIMKLTLSHLFYPYFYLYTVVGSLYNVATSFNLNTWLSEQFSTPIIDLPQFGYITIGRLLLVIYLAVIVNYLIKLTKLILIRIDKTKYETGNAAVAITIGTTVIWFCYLVTVLMVQRINHSGIVAAIGGASLGLGFAMKDTFENFFCGLSLMATRARPGDIVECDGERGIIKKIGIISTQIQIEDGPIVSFPNRQIFSHYFTNLTLNNRREIRHIIFDISDTSDIEKAKTLMLQAAEGVEGVVDMENHYVVMKHTSCGIVRLDYKCWIDSSRYLRTEPAVREAIFNASKANGIEIASLPNEIDMRATATIMGNKFTL